jgi:hypothetical protein
MSGMHTRTILCLSLTLTACGQGPCSEEPTAAPTLTYMGASVFSPHAVDPNEFQYLVNMTLYKSGLESLEGVSISLEMTPPVSDGQQVGAFTSPSTRSIHLYSPEDTGCLTSTHMAHELSHWVRFLKTGDGDPGHTDASYWSEPDALVFDLYAFDAGYCKASPDSRAWLLARSQPN